MGNKSSTTFRRVQPSLPFSSHYNRLVSSSSQSDADQSLLGKEDNNHEEDITKLKFEIEANRRKNEWLERKNVGVEKEIQDLRATVSEQAAQPRRIPPILEKNVAALEKQVRELKSTISRLESTITSNPVVTPSASGTGLDALLKEKIDKLEHRLMQLELDSLRSFWKHDDTEKAVQNNEELDNRLPELTTIHQLKPPYCKQEAQSITMEQEFGSPGHDLTNDLVGCLIVLIFLVAVLIGINM